MLTKAIRIIATVSLVVALIVGLAPVASERATAHTVPNHCHINSSYHVIDGEAWNWNAHKSFVYTTGVREHKHYRWTGVSFWYRHSSFTGGCY
jgi:hypothetical protein